MQGTVWMSLVIMLWHHRLRSSTVGIVIVFPVRESTRVAMKIRFVHGSNSSAGCVLWDYNVIHQSSKDPCCTFKAYGLEYTAVTLLSVDSSLYVLDCERAVIEHKRLSTTLHERRRMVQTVLAGQPTTRIPFSRHEWPLTFLFDRVKHFEIRRSRLFATHDYDYYY